MREPLNEAQKAIKAMIEANISVRGGYTKEFLASLGVQYPPPAGWKKRLIREAKGDASHG